MILYTWNLVERSNTLTISLLINFHLEKWHESIRVTRRYRVPKRRYIRTYERQIVRAVASRWVNVAVPRWFPIVWWRYFNIRTSPGDHGARFKSWFTGTPIDTRIMYTLNSYANARKEPRRQYIHIQHRHAAASVYTLRPVFCILSSELIQSRGPPGDFRCGEIVIAAATATIGRGHAMLRFIELSRRENGDGPDRDLGKTILPTLEPFVLSSLL